MLAAKRLEGVALKRVESRYSMAHRWSSIQVERREIYPSIETEGRRHSKSKSYIMVPIHI